MMKRTPQINGDKNYYSGYQWKIWVTVRIEGLIPYARWDYRSIKSPKVNDKLKCFKEADVGEYLYKQEMGHIK